MNTNNEEKKFSRVLQADIPRSTLKEVVALAEALRDNFAGKDASPIDLAKAIDRSPSSSGWRYLTGSAVAYGLLDGGYRASSISLTPLGKQIVNPTEESSRSEGLLMALLRPAVLKSFYEKYNGAKFPKDDITKNVLETLGVPPARTDEALKIIMENAQYLGIMTDTGTGQYIQLRTPVNTSASISNSPLSPFQEEATPTKRHTQLTDIEFVKEKLIVQMQPALLRNKKFREKLDAFMDAGEALAKEIEDETPESQE